jgi:hypothetical protein
MLAPSNLRVLRLYPCRNLRVLIWENEAYRIFNAMGRDHPFYGKAVSIELPLGEREPAF